jgi:hypothetical protein
MLVITDKAYEGLFVRAAWSSRVTILQALYSLTISDQTFLGVKTKTLDHESDHHGLLWIYKDGENFRVWQECRQRPFVGSFDVEQEIEEILGHHEMENGDVYYAVKWLSYTCPTWESEDDLFSCRQATDYCLQLQRSVNIPCHFRDHSEK